MTTTPSLNETETVEEAIRLRTDGVSVIGVGIGQMVSHSELEGVVSYPVNNNTFYVDDYSQLSTYINHIVNSQCNGTAISNIRTLDNQKTLLSNIDTHASLRFVSSQGSFLHIIIIIGIIPSKTQYNDTSKCSKAAKGANL